MELPYWQWEFLKQQVALEHSSKLVNPVPGSEAHFGAVYIIFVGKLGKAKSQSCSQDPSSTLMHGALRISPFWECSLWVWFRVRQGSWTDRLYAFLVHHAGSCLGSCPCEVVSVPLCSNPVVSWILLVKELSVLYVVVLKAELKDSYVWGKCSLFLNVSPAILQESSVANIYQMLARAYFN